MSRSFLYARVSREGQQTTNQELEVRNAGFEIPQHRVFSEIISGSVISSERPVFNKLVDRLEFGDVLVVTKLDRLGRNAIDVRSTIDCLNSRGIKVYCLALGGVDLTSAAGRMTMQVINAVAEFERDLLIERTQAGLRRAKEMGKKLGRPIKIDISKILQLKTEGLSQSQAARALGVSLSTIKRNWKKDVCLT